MNRPRVIDSHGLISLNETAINRNYSRAIDQDWLEAHIDPEGIHVLTCMMFHAGICKCQVLVRVVDGLEPELIWLDIEEESYKNIPIPNTERV